MSTIPTRDSRTGLRYPTRRKLATRRNFAVDALERRTLLANILGSVFADNNGNGVRDPGEGGAAFESQTVFIDSNDNGVVDPGELSTSVDQFGDFGFSLPAGTYIVRLEQDAGFIRTGPATDFRSVTLGSTDVTNVNFGITQFAEMNGTVYNDANGNGTQDSNEPVLPNTTVFIDANNNGKLDSSTISPSSTNVPKSAAGLSTVASNINVSGQTGFVTDVNVTVNITSPNDNDPQVYLEDPQGVRVLLVTPEDTASQDMGHNFVNTVFDDQATKSVSAGVAPFTGSFQTSGFARGSGLSELNNLSPNGTWRLILTDTATPNTATLTGWSLKLTVGDIQTQTFSPGGQYFLYPLPAPSYNLRATRPNFITTQPSGGKYTFALTEGQDKISDFGLQEVGTVNQTVKFGASTPIPNGITDSPWGLNIGDFNKDGHPDIAASNNGSNNVGIYLGNGNGTFKNPVFYPVGNAVRGIASGDFNKDGNIDLVTADKDDGTVSVLLGNGNGTFKPRKTYPAGTGAWAIAVADYNGDGNLDLAVADDNQPVVEILLGKGNGTFGAPTPITVPNDPDAIKVADMNNDKKQDLVIASDIDNSISVLLGNGNGTFKSPITMKVGNDPDGLALGDYNGNGTQDVAVTSYQDDTVEVLLGKGDGSFDATTAQVYVAGDTPQGVTDGDMNNDGKLDLIVSNRSDGLSSPSGSVQIFLGLGDGTFLPPFTYTMDKSPVSTAFSDFNGDGRKDIVSANFNSDDLTIRLNNTIPIPVTTTGGISGSVFSDGNLNGVKDGTDAGLAGAVIYIDTNKDGLLDNGEKSTTTDTSGNWSFTGLAPGSYRVRLQNKANMQHTTPASPTNFFDVTVTAGATASGKVFGEGTNVSQKPVVAIDSGSTSSFIDNSGITFSADTGFTGGTAVSNVYDVTNVDNDPLYYTFRQGTSFTYNTTLANGSYVVKLLFADPTKTASGQRKFNVIAQGNTVLSNFDVVANGGAKKVIAKSFTVSVTNGKLTLQFTSTVDQAIVSAIEVFQAA